jgi:hypothetical protein
LKIPGEHYGSWGEPAIRLKAHSKVLDSQGIRYSDILEYRMVRTRTPAADLRADGIEVMLAALESAGITAVVRPPEGAISGGTWQPDFELRGTIDDRSFTALVEVKANGTGQIIAQLIGRARAQGDAIPLLVADRITAEARTMLDDAGWSWLDRRGRLHLRAPGVRVDLDVPAAERATTSTVGPPITGRAGITIAYWLCDHPGQSVSPNRSRRLLNLAPSTISTTVQRLADAGLVDESGAAIAPELFWELAAVWRTERTWLVQRPDPAQHTPIDPDAASWRLTGTAAAAAYGAPVAAAGKGALELYVNGPVELSIATRRYGAAAPGAGAAIIAVPPTTLVNQPVEDATVPTVDGWPAAPLLAVALDLAQDGGRGREILADWKVEDGVWL